MLHGVHALDAFADGDRLHLLVADYDGRQPQPRLLYLHSADAGGHWAAPVEVGQGLPPAFAARRGMDPQIAAKGDCLIAAWMTAGTDPFGGGPMATALSHDGGKTWKPGPNPADDGSTTGHGFLDLAVDASGAFHVTWLDSRSQKRGVRYARSTDAGASWSKNATIDAQTCECCWNTLATSSGDTVAILYRDKDPRDMRIATSGDLGMNWNRPITVGSFQWDFPGCPHVGGALALQSAVCHALVWTGQSGQEGIHHLHSSDAGLTWSTPARLAAAPASHPSLAMDAAGRLLAAWDHQSADGAAIEFVRSDDQGSTWSQVQRPANHQGQVSHPLALVTSSAFHLFWTEQGPHQPAVWRHTTIPTKQN